MCKLYCRQLANPSRHRVLSVWELSVLLKKTISLSTPLMERHLNQHTDVPMRPLDPRMVDLMPFSATPQWDPPSDNGRSSLLLTYTVILTSTSSSNVTATSLPLPNLQHSTCAQYSWSVHAINEYGSRQ